LAYQKYNPRPPSAALNKQVAMGKNNDEEDYENDGSDGFEKEDEDDELRLEKIRKAMLKENAKAQKATEKLGPVTSKPAFVQVKQGPINPADRKPSASILNRLNNQDDDFIPDVSS